MEFTEIAARALVFAAVFVVIGGVAQWGGRYLRSLTKSPPSNGDAPRT